MHWSNKVEVGQGPSNSPSNHTSDFFFAKMLWIIAEIFLIIAALPITLLNNFWSFPNLFWSLQKCFLSLLNFLWSLLPLQSSDHRPTFPELFLIFAKTLLIIGRALKEKNSRNNQWILHWFLSLGFHPRIPRSQKSQDMSKCLLSSN